MWAQTVLTPPHGRACASAARLARRLEPATTASACRPCLQGTYAPDAGSLYCDLCPPGQVAVGEGSTQCAAGSAASGKPQQSARVVIVSFSIVLDGTKLNEVRRVLPCCVVECRPARAVVTASARYRSGDDRVPRSHRERYTGPGAPFRQRLVARSRVSLQSAVTEAPAPPAALAAQVCRETTGINGSSADIVRILVAADTARALGVPVTAVTVTGLTQSSQRTLVAGVSVTVLLDDQVRRRRGCKAIAKPGLSLACCSCRLRRCRAANAWSVNVNDRLNGLHADWHFHAAVRVLLAYVSHLHHRLLPNALSTSSPPPARAASRPPATPARTCPRTRSSSA